MAESSDVVKELDRSISLSETRKEIKELKGKIQGLKKTIKKGDKRKKKEVAEEIAKLEDKLKSLEAYKATLDKSESVTCEESVKCEEGVICEGVSHAREQLNEFAVNEKQDVGVASVNRKSKAQRRKEKKLQEERERDERIATGEAQSSLNNPRLIERESLDRLLSPQGLTVKDVPADGHCLYAALSDQLLCRAGLKVSVSRLRSECSQYILSHSDEFLPYLVDPNTGDQFTQEQFQDYCQEIADTAVWGGQLEIQALCHVYKFPVRVYQADTPVVTVGEDYHHTPLTLSYHRHEYGLGEHYNSIIPNTASS